MSRYAIIFTPVAKDHLQRMTARQRAIILGAVERTLTFQPVVETRNWKPRHPDQPERAVWELRIGRYRVYFETEDDSERVVYILAAGVKRRNRVYVAGEV